MKKYLLSKLFIIFVFVFSFLSITACDNIKMEIHTKINPDGKVFRNIKYVYKPSDKKSITYLDLNTPDILAKCFMLPQDSPWTVNKYIENDQYIYSAEATFEDLNEMQGDFNKKSKYFGSAKNYSSLLVEDYTKYTNFDFLEIFRDSSDIIKFSQHFIDYLNDNKQGISTDFYKILKKDLPDFSQNEAQEIVDMFIDQTASFNNLVKSFKIIGPKERKQIEEKFELIDKEIHVSTLIDYLDSDTIDIPDSHLCSLFKFNSVELKKEERKQILDKLGSFVNKQLQIVSQEYNIDPLGAFNTTKDMFNNYEFDYILEIPGDISSTNGTKTSSNILRWHFTPIDFFNHDYVIIAKSRLDKISE